ncbi:GspE/PulE family protein [Desulfosporosinus meridiei]|uniref:Type II secretory pathway, ATPase PulE/Tfp pilus assembly pathway, ATPase PilB n=1 Tax=Desulfosporosinus meridiei (strain ATCC BAA-275 / DSM 13257 / KCTC 12902 / NCIMB 13706 / S10) TaxID=768704 RepID=J7IV84_DESMD|nr:GspE/PulE family protein [Desulfosporosinus meridiei]AFQ43023.1 type II secretory pathway, ATPase PulE/Tfp pilus assembly pathway, ATPase PilB [Desulfosporosinus meridiei DSM 13257]
MVTRNDYDFGQYLYANGYLDEAGLAMASELALKGEEPIGDVLLRTGILEKASLSEALRSYLGIQAVKLTRVIIDPAVAGLISEEIARRYTLIPFERYSGVLKVAMSDPTHERALRDVRMLTGLEIEPLYAAKEEIEAAIRQYLTVEQSVARLADIGDSVFENSGVWSTESSKTLEYEFQEDEAPTLKFVNSILHEAVLQGVSDIHWEPRKNLFVVRYRIDGKLIKKHDLALKAARSIVSSLKVMAHMDVAERRFPQDGRMTFSAGVRRVDLRMSSMPTVYGEKVVVRILDPEMAQRSLDSLGMRQDVRTGVQALLKRPNGLILVVGPTGSGKTTTLYALLRELNAEEQNIISIEDPVEYQLSGVNQVQVNLPAGLSFPVGLKHILRQDPDVIMIGEIRDEETAGIAITASLTGHLVLSTLHTNTAAAALARLIDMGVEPYLLASAVSGVLSQRLVRRLCEHCKTQYKISEAEKRAFRLPVSINYLYRSVGCPECLGTGYRGRIGIHEFLLYSQEIKELVLSVQNARDIEQQAMVSGMLTVSEDGFLKVQQGLTTVEEVLRVTSGIEE